MNGFFQELKRPKVYRVAIAYAVASWALAQGLAQVVPVFDISNSAIRSVIADRVSGCAGFGVDIRCDARGN
jgi:hypothetical protein